MDISSINAMGAYGATRNIAQPAADAASTTANFAEILNGADRAVTQFAFETMDAQGVVEALAEAEMALQAAVTVRDRVVGAYQELLRMPL